MITGIITNIITAIITDTENSKKSYFDYIRMMKDRNWKKENITIHEYLSTIVNTNNLDSGNSGIVLDILCPAGRIISIPGIKDFPVGYDIERIPFFELKLSDSVKDIDPDTKIKVIKHKILRKDEEICQLLYRDVSYLNYNPDTTIKFKYNEQLYRFNDMIELKGEDRLKIYVENPDIDINTIKFNINVDLWTRP